MKYIRNIFQQDLREGKQIAFTKEPSNVFFGFDFNKPDPERRIKFKFIDNNPGSKFAEFHGTEIQTRLYAIRSESRIDGELKHFLISVLNAVEDDLIIFTFNNVYSFEFEFIPKHLSFYSAYKALLGHHNHLIISEQDPEEEDNQSEALKLELENLKENFADWFINYDGNKHRYFSDSFASKKEKLIENLTKYENIYKEQFGTPVFECPSNNLDELIEELEINLYKNAGEFFEFSKITSNHMPRAILGRSNYLSFLEEIKINHLNIPKVDFNVSAFKEDCKSSGLIYDSLLIDRFVSSLMTKPFVILSGLSGSGKTKLAQAFANWICQDESQYCIVPVGADWTNREPLLGYINSLENDKYVKPEIGALDIIIDANKYPHLPYFLILDEMNLSHVERYFADFLSVMESKGKISILPKGVAIDGIEREYELPSNLFIIGTVNIDETTYMFSPKVLDRANTIEFRLEKKDIELFCNSLTTVDMKRLKKKGASMASSFLTNTTRIEFDDHVSTNINSTLANFFEQLKKAGAEFGFRSASEIIRLINQLSIINPDLKENKKLDIAIMQKLLPKLHGSRNKLCKVLITLAGLCLDAKKTNIQQKDIEKLLKDDFEHNTDDVLYSISLEKISRMYRGAIENGFASYAEA